MNAPKYVIEKSILSADRRAYSVDRSGTEVSKKMLKTKILIIVDNIFETYIYEKLILYYTCTLHYVRRELIINNTKCTKIINIEYHEMESLNAKFSNKFRVDLSLKFGTSSLSPHDFSTSNIQYPDD